MSAYEGHSDPTASVEGPLPRLGQIPSLKQYNIRATKGSLRGDVGVPLALLKARLI